MKNLLILLVVLPISIVCIGQNKFDENVRIGADLLEQEAYKQAIGYLNKAIKYRKEAKNEYSVANIYNVIAQCNMVLGKYTVALKVANDGLDFKPEYGDLYYTKCKILNVQKRYNESIVCAEKGLAVKPKFEDLAILKATATWELDSFDLAMRILDTVIVYNGKNRDALNLLSSYKVSRKMYEEGIAICTKLIELDPQDYGALYNRAIHKAHLKDFDGALRDMELGMDIDTTLRWIGLNNIGYFIKFEQGDYEGAIEMFNQAIELKPDFSYAYNNRGYAKLKLGDFKGARKDINKALALDPENSYAYKTLAQLLLAESKNDAACENLQKAIALGYNDHYDDEVNELIEEHCSN